MLYLPSFADCIYDPVFSDLLYDKIINEHNAEDLREKDYIVSLIYDKLDYDKFINKFVKLYVNDLNRYIKEKTNFNCNLKILSFSRSEKYIFIELKEKVLRRQNIKKIANLNNVDCDEILQKYVDEYNTTADLAMLFDNIDLIYKKNAE